MGTARGEEAYILEALPNAFSRPVTTRWALCRCIWGSSKGPPGWRGDALLLLSWPSIATLFSQTLP